MTHLCNTHSPGTKANSGHPIRPPCQDIYDRDLDEIVLYWNQYQSNKDLQWHQF